MSAGFPGDFALAFALATGDLDDLKALAVLKALQNEEKRKSEQATAYALGVAAGLGARSTRPASSQTHVIRQFVPVSVPSPKIGSVNVPDNCDIEIETSTDATFYFPGGYAKLTLTTTSDGRAQVQIAGPSGFGDLYSADIVSKDADGSRHIVIERKRMVVRQTIVRNYICQ